MDVAIRISLGKGDFVKFRQSEGTLLLGEVVATVSDDRLCCRIYSPMTTSILTKFLLPPINTSTYPVVAGTTNTEVVATNIFQTILRDAVEDLIFILPLTEVESGNVFITGASNLFFVRYLIDQTTHSNFTSVNYFGSHFIQPLTIRIFCSLNTLAFTVKRLMYHRPEAEDTRRSTRIFFPSDAFNYLAHKMRDASTVKCRSSKNQRSIKYYDNLKSESTTKVVDVTYLRVLTESSLKELRTILGVGVGIGSTQYRPSKTRPLQYCTINSVLTSVECGSVLPAQVSKKPLVPCLTDGIELSYYEQNSTLSCHVRFSRLRVVSSEVVTSRITAANVIAENPGAYEGAWFQYNGNTFEVRRIESGVCFCRSVEEEGVEIQRFPINLVNDLVNKLGT